MNNKENKEGFDEIYRIVENIYPDAETNDNLVKKSKLKYDLLRIMEHGQGKTLQKRIEKELNKR